MTLRSTAMAGAAPFAHLLGLGRASAKAKAEDEREDDRDEDKEKDSKKAAKAETEGEGDRDDDKSDDDKPEGKKAKGKKASVEDGDDDEDEEEMRSKTDAAAARARERARCAAIFSSPAAAGQPHVAAQIAFGTTMGVNAAIKLMQAPALTAAPQPLRRASLDERMAAQNTAPIASGPAAPRTADPDAELAAQIVAAGKVRRGELKS